MKTTLLALLSTLTSTLAYGPITYDSANNSYICAPGAYAYCAGNSGGTNIILRCVNGIGSPGNCDDNLGEPAAYNAFCYDSAPDSPGDAVCAIQGTYQYENSTMTSYTVVTTSIPTSSPTSVYSNSTVTSSGGSGGVSTTTTVVAPDCGSTTMAPSTVVPPPITASSPTSSATVAPVSLSTSASSSSTSPSSTGILTGGAGKTGAGVGFAAVLAAAVMAF